MVSSYQEDWIEEDKQRSMLMERLFVLDGRHLDTHSRKHTYTGLWKEYQTYLKWKDLLEEE